MEINYPTILRNREQTLYVSIGRGMGWGLIGGLAGTHGYGYLAHGNFNGTKPTDFSVLFHRR